MSESTVTQLHLEDMQSRGDNVLIAARCLLPTGKEHFIELQVSAVDQSLLGNLGNAFTVLSVFIAMRHGSRLHVHAPVCPKLRLNLCEFSKAWSQWAPDLYQSIEITSSNDASAQGQENAGHLVPFSGGLDSCHHLLHLLGSKEERIFRSGQFKALLVHGFDIPVQDHHAFHVAARNAQAILDSVGVGLLTVRCNIRDLPHHWENEHGAALAGCLHLFAGGFNQASIAGSHSYSTLRFPWGSNPLSDPLLSSTDMEIRYGGLAYTRNHKARELAAWPEAMERLRPCWQLSGTGENCGRCLRCIATALNFAAEGIAPPEALRVGALTHAVDALDALKIYPVALQRLKDSVLEPARANGVHAPWVRKLDELIQKKQRRLARKQLRRDIRSFLMGSFK